MKNAFGPIYEVTISVDREIVDQFDAWLAHHVKKMLQISGISRAEVLEQEDNDQGRARRITNYYFVSDPDLEQYLSGPAEAMRQSAIDRFEGRFEAIRRVLRHTDIAAGELHPVEVCLNCGTTLDGQYCGNCGQRANSRLISVWELLRDAFGDLLELDSRLWRTLIPLTIRPGQLTRDYLEDRRARFMPPFRMYLVLSIVFFLVAFFDPREELGFLYEPQTPSAIESEQDSSEADAIRAEIFRDLAEEGIIVDNSVRTEAGNADSEDDDDGDSDTNCDADDINSADLPDWLASRLTEERLNVMCDRIIADDGKAFGKKLLDNVPAALFVLLPLMALVLKILYPLSKRYYVEHLLIRGAQSLVYLPDSEPAGPAYTTGLTAPGARNPDRCDRPCDIAVCPGLPVQVVAPRLRAGPVLYDRKIFDARICLFCRLDADIWPGRTVRRVRDLGRRLLPRLSARAATTRI